MVSSLLLAALLSSAPCGLTPVEEAGRSRLFTFTCDNGLPGVVESRPGTGTVFVQIGVRVGSRDEPRRLAGISHLLEHLLFKEGHGTSGVANPALAALRDAGAVINGSTDFELTEFHADLPASDFERGLVSLVSLVTRPVFPEKEIDRERDVVLQEIVLGKTDPLAIAAYSVLRRLFPGDPIGQPVIGFRRSLRRVTKADLEQHYDGFYVPSNMFIVIVGDVEPLRAASLVGETLGSVSGEGGRHPPYPVPEPRYRPRYRFRTLVSQSYLLAGALTGGALSEDALALELLSTILGDSRASRLHRRLVEKEAMTREVTAISFLVSNAGAFASGLAVHPSRTEQARSVLQEELLRLSREPVSARELATARALHRGRLALQFETNQGRAEFRSHCLRYGRELSRDILLRQADELEPGHLLAVAGRYWGIEQEDPAARGPVEIQVLPARGLGKVIAALRFLIFRRL